METQIDKNDLFIDHFLKGLSVLLLADFWNFLLKNFSIKMQQWHSFSIKIKVPNTFGSSSLDSEYQIEKYMIDKLIQMTSNGSCVPKICTIFYGIGRSYGFDLARPVFWESAWKKCVKVVSSGCRVKTTILTYNLSLNLFWVSSV